MSGLTQSGRTLGSYGYNAKGERTSKVPWNSAVVRFVYGEDQRLLAERQDGTNTWTSYLWFGGELVGMVRGSNVYFIHTDQVGRPELATDSSRAVVWARNNNPFGGDLGHDGDRIDSIGGLNVGFPGQYFDAESGLWYNLNRYYDDMYGRYTQADPIGLAAGINPYTYATSNPLSFSDSLGLCDNHCNTPTAPTGVSVDANIRLVEAGMILDPEFTIVGMAYAMHTGGPWDYKNSYHNSKYDAFGNFNYGATGAAAGIPVGILQWFAGAYQYSQGHSPVGSSPFSGGSNGDNPSSQEEIAAGADYFRDCPHW
jgi:RHS repeat-associated protein